MNETPTSGTSRRMGLVLDPLDVLFFRDGRPFEAGYRLGHDTFPFPQTLAGALRTALLGAENFNFSGFSKILKGGKDVREALEENGAPSWIINARFRGPWFAYVTGTKTEPTVEPLLPLPATLVRDPEGKNRGDGKPAEWTRLDPLEQAPPGWSPPMEAHSFETPLWTWKKRVKKSSSSSFLRLSGLKAFLEGGVPDPSHVVDHREIYDFDHRTGIGITADSLTAEEGMIYSAAMLALKRGKNRDSAPDVKLYCEALFPEGPPRDDPFARTGPIPFGGQSRYVTCDFVSPVEWPEFEMSKNGGAGEFVYLATPAIFEKGWIPDSPENHRWTAAAVPSAIAVSGWDIARGGPKPTRFAVPAGSVYFSKDKILVEGDRSLCGDMENVAQGWGFFLKGVWNYA